MEQTINQLKMWDVAGLPVAVYPEEIGFSGTVYVRSGCCSIMSSPGGSTKLVDGRYLLPVREIGIRESRYEVEKVLCEKVYLFFLVEYGK